MKLGQLFFSAGRFVAPQLHSLGAVALDQLDIVEGDLLLPLERDGLRVPEGRRDAAVVDLRVGVQVGLDVLESRSKK